MTNVQHDTTNPPAKNPFGLQKTAYGITETVELLSIGRSSLYALIRRGELEPVKVGKKTLFLAPDLTRFLNRLRGA
jgi:excisionase family DNA binding protein